MSRMETIARSLPSASGVPAIRRRWPLAFPPPPENSIHFRFESSFGLRTSKPKSIKLLLMKCFQCLMETENSIEKRARRGEEERVKPKFRRKIKHLMKRNRLCALLKRPNRREFTRLIKIYFEKVQYDLQSNPSPTRRRSVVLGEKLSQKEIRCVNTSDR